jgi:urease accessory protein
MVTTRIARPGSTEPQPIIAPLRVKAMPRAKSVLKRPRPDDAVIADTLVLNLDQRRMHRGAVVTVKGASIELDLDAPVWLRTDDVLVLEDGALIEVVAAAEPLLEVRAPDVQILARVAWMLGDRHVPVQILGSRMRLHRDPAINEMLSRFAVKLTEIEAPFDPEGGAYAGGDHGHDQHDHDHGDHHHHEHHGHAHHHDHMHDHGHHHHDHEH